MLISVIPSCSRSLISPTLYQKKGNQEDKSQLANRQHEFKFLQRLAPSLFAAFSFCLLSSLLQAIDVQRGASLFNRACIGCHDAGGNILQPGFGEMCTPRGQCTFGARLQEDEIRLLSDFVKSQADQGWPNIGNDKQTYQMWVNNMNSYLSLERNQPKNILACSITSYRRVGPASDAMASITNWEVAIVNRAPYPPSPLDEDSIVETESDVFLHVVYLMVSNVDESPLLKRTGVRDLMTSALQIILAS
ncbi:hypothetical protein E3N88_01476 [Mikania micrantha]|uniref:Cytochrome c-553 n=1 Tax=Mikania micrantha TaxID=192012 RepID=A0A5N6Q3T3_9ASTR|nr:hypothetical protein E3N88_01476 [Mikania micrantha]